MKILLKKIDIKLIIGVILVCAFLWRLVHTIDGGDEVQNLTMAYRIVLGQRPWVDVWEVFQSGNSYAAPFLRLFVSITGSTDGIILYSRLVFFLMNICLAILFYNIFRKYITDSIVYITSIAIICYAPFSLYYIWYDTMGLYFMLLGSVLLFNGIQSKNHISLSMLLAGISHALMSYAYPSFVLLALLYGVIIFYLRVKLKGSKREAVGYTVQYFLGAALIFAIFILYIIAVGYNNTIFADTEILKWIFESHNSTFGMGRKLLHLISQPVRRMWHMIIPSCLLLLLFLYNFRRRNNSWFIALLMGIILIPFMILLHAGTLAIIYFTFYLFCWSPFLKMLLTRKEPVLLQLFWILWLPSIFSYILMGLTSNNGGLKAPLGTYCGWIYAIIVIGVFVEEIVKNNKLKIIGCLSGIVTCMIVLFYTNTFWYGQFYESDYRFQNGIFKSLYGKGEDVSYQNKLERIRDAVRSGDEYILFVGTDLLSAYLYTDLKPATFFFLWTPYIKSGDVKDWSPTLEYWKKVSGLPDLLVVSNKEKNDAFLESLLEQKYYILSNEDEFVIWRIKS